MKLKLLMLSLLSTLLFVACGEGEEPDGPLPPPQGASVAIAEIIAEMEAEKFCEFICSGYEDITKNCAQYANAIGVDIGAMGSFSASQYKSWGYTWHNRDKSKGITADKINTYLNAGMEVSVYTIDTDSDWAQIESYHTKLRGITTNYPNRIIAKTR